MEYLKNITRFGLNFTFLANVTGSMWSPYPSPEDPVRGADTGVFCVIYLLIHLLHLIVY